MIYLKRSTLRFKKYRVFQKKMLKILGGPWPNRPTLQGPHALALTNDNHSGCVQESGRPAIHSAVGPLRAAVLNGATATDVNNRIIRERSRLPRVSAQSPVRV